MAYLTDYQNAQDGNLLAQIQESLCVQAANIQSEATNTANHAQRSALSYAVLNNPRGYAVLFAYSICAGGTITVGSTDAAIDTRIAALWNAWSGILT